MTPSIKWFLLGFLSILFGIFAINHALLTSIAVTVLVGAMLVLSGVAQVVLGVNEDGIWRKLLSLGLGTLLVASFPTATHSFLLDYFDIGCFISLLSYIYFLDPIGFG